MNDYSADDMRFGDLSAAQLKIQFGLVNVSARVNPYTLAKITPFNQPQPILYIRGITKPITPANRYPARTQHQRLDFIFREHQRRQHKPRT